MCLARHLTPVDYLLVTQNITSEASALRWVGETGSRKVAAAQLSITVRAFHDVGEIRVFSKAEVQLQSVVLIETCKRAGKTRPRGLPSNEVDS